MSSLSGKNNSAAAIRGLLLVVVAAAIGVLLLRSGGDDDTASATDDQTTTETTIATLDTTVAGDDTDGADDSSSTDDATDSTGDDVTSTTLGDSSDNSIDGFQPRPPAEVLVQVANSTDVRGAASRVTDRLKVLGFVTLTPTNLRGTPLDQSKVHYMPGSLLEAQNIAEVLELDRQNDVFQMFEDTTAIGDYEMPDVLVAIGADLAR